LRPLIACLALLAFATTLPALAQAPGRRAANNKKGKAQTAPRAPSPDAPPPGEIHITAESQGRDKGHYWARGFVDFRQGETRLQADSMDIYEDEQPDGSVKRRIVADGNVVFIQEGEHMTMDAETGEGTFQKAVGFVQPGMFVQADSIERVNPTTYRVFGGHFTSCAQPNPRWAFSASRATVYIDDKVTMWNALFRIKDLPVLYFPFFYYPIRRDQRSTGFLIPHAGHSSTRGYDVGDAFFWVMGRSADQTFYVDRFSLTGYGVGHELRWALPSPSHGDLSTYVFQPSAPGAPYDYDLDWKAIEYFPGHVKGSLNVRWFSNTLFQQLYQDNLTLALTRNRRSSVSFQRTVLAGAVLAATADDNEVYFGTTTRTNKHVPSLRLTQSSEQFGRTGINLRYDLRAEDLGRKVVQDDGTVSRDSDYWRFDGGPTLSRPVSLTFLDIDPSISYRYTHYGVSVDPDDGTFTGPALDRKYFESEIDARGPTFSKVFVSGGVPKVKHVIGPEITWTYRTAVDDFDAIPKFDGADQMLGTNQIEYALVNQVLVKRMGSAGKPVASELLTWRVGQTYYVQIDDNQAEFDPNYSSGAFGSTGEPTHLSPIQSRFSLKPTDRATFTFDTEYDLSFKAFRSFTLASTIHYPRVDLTAAWAKTQELDPDITNQVISSNTVRGSARFEVFPNRLQLDGSLDYDFVEKTLISARARAHLGVQCCGFSAEVIKYDFNDRQETQFRISLELANVGSFGTFLGGKTTAGSIPGTTSIP
jgi:lipopolysaccharide assembly outer membrane protein LptD (OstA)